MMECRARSSLILSLAITQIGLWIHQQQCQKYTDIKRLCHARYHSADACKKHYSPGFLCADSVCPCVCVHVRPSQVYTR